MWQTEHTAYTHASPEDVWALWSDVTTWPTWDSGIQRANIEGRFAACASGTLKPTGGPQVTLTIIDAKPNHGFVDETKLPLARMRFEHEVASDAERTRITHRVQITGPAAPLFARVIGRGIARDLPETIAALARLASERGARKVVVA